MDLMQIESLVVITTIQPLLLLWLGAISFFISLAVTAMLSRGRRWFELVVIFALAFAVFVILGGVFFQWILGVQIFQLEAIESLRMDYT